MSSGSPTSLIAFGDAPLTSPPPSAASHAAAASPLFTYQCVLEGIASTCSSEFARLEVNAAQPHLVRLWFAEDAHVLAAAAAAASDMDEEEEVDSAATLYQQHKQRRPFSRNPQFAVQLKLLVLAAAVRMAAAISSPSATNEDTTSIMKRSSAKSNLMTMETNALYDKSSNDAAIASSTEINNGMVINHAQNCCTIV